MVNDTKEEVKGKTGNRSAGGREGTGAAKLRLRPCCTYITDILLFQSGEDMRMQH